MEKLIGQNGIYSIYIKRLEAIFYGDYLADRDIDRALWVYGHMFKSDRISFPKWLEFINQ